MEKYIGRVVEIIYLGRDNRITQRCIEVREVQDRIIKAFCLQRRAPRVFRIENILAMQPVESRVS